MNPCENSKNWGNKKHQPLADFAFSSIRWCTTRRFQERQKGKHQQFNIRVTVNLCLLNLS